MHVRVYHPETCEPFDVPTSKAEDLVLNKGWTKTPWKHAEPEAAPEPVVTEVGRGRGRRRRVVEDATPVEPVVESEDEAEAEEAEDADDNAGYWRS